VLSYLWRSFIARFPPGQMAGEGMPATRAV
jgi:hypothetical protein